MILNLRKWQYLKLNKDISNEGIELDKKALHAEVDQNLLDIMKDEDLNLPSHANLILKTANQKLSALIRVS